MSIKNQVLLVAAENSAENYAGQVLTAFQQENDQDFHFFGLGGSGLAAAGLEVLVDNSELAVVGIFEVLGHVLKLRRIREKLLAEAVKRGARAALLIDYPDFNFSLAAGLKAAGIRVYHYISPTVWAWRYRRIERIRRLVDHLFIIFPFEKRIFEREGIAHTYTGHPLLQMVAAGPGRDQARLNYGLLENQDCLVLLPGSRPSEIKALLPVMLSSLEQLRRQRTIKVFLLRARGVSRALLGHGGLPEDIEIVEQDQGAGLLAAADLVITTCGTSTLKTALLGVPMIALYRVNPLSYFLGRRFVKIDLYSIVNILAGRWLVPELIQADCSAENLSREALRMLEDPGLAAETTAAFTEIRDGLDLDLQPALIIRDRLRADLA